MASRSFDVNRWLSSSGLLLSFVACGGGTFSAGKESTNGGASGGGSAGDGARAGASGSDGGASAGGTSGGTGGGTGGAGTGGKAATGCDCAAGSYCQDGANQCRSCADFSRLEFAAPQKLSTLSRTASGQERYPRAASAGADLFYRAGAAGLERLWYAATPESGVGKQISASSASTAGAAGFDDSAPLLAPGVLAQNFFFDHTDTTTNVRHVMLATWSGGALSAAVPAPPPLNDAGSDFSVAVAPGVARAYWMSTRNGGTAAQLLSASMIDGTVTAPVVVDLKIQAGTGDCPWTGGAPSSREDDATPWVNSAGTLLLFRSQSVDDMCQSNDSGAFDLFAAPLSKDTGMPTAAGIPLAALNRTGGGSTQTDPSLSPDSCSIYFASDNGTADPDLYRAARN